MEVGNRFANSIPSFSETPPKPLCDNGSILWRPKFLRFTEKANMGENVLRTELAQEPIRHRGVIVAVPQGPGLGIEIDREVLQKYC